MILLHLPYRFRIVGLRLSMLTSLRTKTLISFTLLHRRIHRMDIGSLNGLCLHILVCQITGTISRVCWFSLAKQACTKSAVDIGDSEGVAELLTWHCADATRPEILEELGLAPVSLVYLYAYPTLLVQLQVRAALVSKIHERSTDVAMICRFIVAYTIHP